MTQYTDTTYGGPTPSVDPSPGSPSTAAVAKDEVRNVGQTAAEAGSQVVGTAADQAKQVTQETKRQAQDLLAQGRTQATEQARTGQAQAASSLSALAGELRSMVDHDHEGEHSGGPAHDLVRQATGRVDDVAEWLKNHEPEDVLTEVRDFARRRPVAFLFGAVVAGVVAGRLTTGVVAAHKDSSDTTAPATGALPPVQPVVSTYPDVAPVEYAAVDYPTTDYPTTDYASTDYAEVPPVEYDSVPPADYRTQGDVPPLPYGSEAPATPAHWVDPEPITDDGRRL